MGVAAASEKLSFFNAASQEALTIAEWVEV